MSLNVKEMNDPDKSNFYEDNEAIDLGELVEILDDNSESIQDVENDLDDIEISNDLDIDEITDSVPDDSKLVFNGHNGSLFCVAVDNSSTLVVTGAEDDVAHVWNLKDASIVFTCLGHSDSVTSVTFNHNCSYLATADMGGCVIVWDVNTHMSVWTYEVGDLECIEWHPNANVLLTGTSSGEIWMFKIPKTDCKIYPSHGCECDHIKIFQDGLRCAAGYHDGSIKIWSLKDSNVLHHISGNFAHSDQITCLDVHHEGVLIATGSIDCSVKLMNSQNGKTVNTLQCCANSEDNSIEVVKFAPNINILAVGTLDGYLFICDTSTFNVRFKCGHESGITRLLWSPCYHYIHTATLDGILHTWDFRNGELIHSKYGHSSEILDIAISDGGQNIITASNDHTARIFEIKSI